MKSVWTALEQLPYIIPPNDRHSYLDHEKLSFGGVSSHVRCNKHKGSSTVKHLFFFFFADRIRKLVSRWNKR